MIGIIVAPGFVFSNSTYNTSESIEVLHVGGVAYLSIPPPSAGVHIVIQPLCFLPIRVVTFGGKTQVLSMLRITVECLNTLNDVAHE